MLHHTSLRAHARITGSFQHLRCCYLAYLVSLAFLVGCDETPRSAQRPSPPLQPPAATQSAPPVGASLPAVVPPPAPTPAQRGHHRYVGTVKGRRVLVELHVEPDYPTAPHFHCEGTYYYLDSGQPHALRAEGLWQPTQPLELQADGAYWCLTQALGPTLSGSCISLSGQPLGAVSLHESYAGAAHYEVLTETLHEGLGARVNGEQDTSSFTRSYLHLLGRYTLRPALARLQCPAPAQRLRGRRKALAAHAGPLFTEEVPLVVWLEEDLTVTLNEADLLAYYVEQGVAYGGSGRGYLSLRNYLVDLRTGRRLQLVSQLRPGGLLQLRRLLTHHAKRDTAAHLLADYLQGPLLRLPPEGFILQPAGCDAYYGYEDSHEGNSPSFQETISWAELRPLLRPQSPLWRLIRARGSN